MLKQPFTNGILKACDEVCGKKNGRRNRGDTWWCNEEVKKALQLTNSDIFNDARDSI